MKEEWKSERPGEHRLVAGDAVLGEVYAAPTRYYWSCGENSGECFTLAFAKAMVEQFATWEVP